MEAATVNARVLRYTTGRVCIKSLLITTCNLPNNRSSLFISLRSLLTA